MYSDKVEHTLNTTRICGGDHFKNAIEISNVVYADKSPNSVIITNGDIIQEFTFTSAENPFNCAAGSIFAHLGKHSPTLVIKKDELPEVTLKYIESVKPLPKEEPAPPYMHGWIIGCDNDITYSTQIEIEKALSIDEEQIH